MGKDPGPDSGNWFLQQNMHSIKGKLAFNMPKSRGLGCFHVFPTWKSVPLLGIESNRARATLLRSILLVRFIPRISFPSWQIILY